jgi:hypothetical protein
MSSDKIDVTATGTGGAPEDAAEGISDDDRN